MQKILIADRSDDICFVLKKQLQKEFEVSTCNDGSTALALIRGMHPDGLILDLRLPMLDGISLLRELQGALPPAVLAISDTGRDYEHRTAIDLGAGYVIARPFETRAVCGHIRGLMDYARNPNRPPVDPRSIVSAHLTRLGLDCSHDGYQQLRLGIPLFMQDPSLQLGKELYPAIISLWGRGDPVSVEHTVRRAIVSAWKTRDPAVWEEYFRGCTKCPNNKKFIARLAEFLEYPQD